MRCIWGYTSSATLSEDKELGKEIKEAKQVFSALLFKHGIKGMSIKVSKISGIPKVVIDLLVDDKIKFTSHFSPTEIGEFFFEMEEVCIPETKIEVLICVDDGSIYLPISAIGNGMGYQRIKNEFLPTNHLGLGLIIPQD